MYKSKSEFLFPLDVDELITVIRRDETDEMNETIEWNKVDFLDALDKLGDEGKSFKMETADPVPADCGTSTQDYLQDNNTSTLSPKPMILGYTGEMCHVKHAKRKGKQCMDKSFVRGKDYFTTDTGNHHMRTRNHKYTGLMCSEGLSGLFERSDLLLLHVQSLGFSTWLVHGLRGSADYGFNNLDGKCNGVNGIHYCWKWQKFYNAKFSPYELRKMYKEEMCPATRDGLSSIERVTAQSCSRT